MGQQSLRQAARRAALDGQAQRRRERAERDKRIEALALDVLTALEERRAAIADCEQRAGAAIRKLTGAEGLTVKEAAGWCGEELTGREIRRLARLAGIQPSGTSMEDVLGGGASAPADAGG